MNLDTAISVFQECQARGIHIRVDGSNLKCRPKTALDERLFNALRDHKPEIMQICQMEAEKRFKAFLDQYGEEMAERFAIMTVDGGLSDEEAINLILNRVSIH